MVEQAPYRKKRKSRVVCLRMDEDDFTHSIRSPGKAAARAARCFDVVSEAFT